MRSAKKTVLLVRVAIAALSIASIVHLFEHWETVFMDECLSHGEHSHASSDSSHDDSSHTSHNHGCSSHEHSPAVLQTASLFFPLPMVVSSCEEKITAPPPLHREIDQPPRIS